MTQPTDANLIFGFLITITINQIFDFGQTHTEDERLAEIARLEKNPDDIVINLDAFIADQCVSEESIKSFRNVYKDETIQPADVAKRVFGLFERFPKEVLRSTKALALISATTEDAAERIVTDSTLMVIIEDTLSIMSEQAAQLN